MKKNSLLEEDIYEETRNATRPPMTYTAFKNLLSIIKTTPESTCLLYTSPSPRDRTRSRMPSSA